MRPLLYLIGLVLALAACGRTPLDTYDDGGAPRRDAGGACSADEQCDDGIFCNGREACVAELCAPSPAPSCDDGDTCTTDVCDESANSCVSMPLLPDADFDGFMSSACGGVDCDDSDPSVNPAAVEVCGDGLDNNCDGRADCDDASCRSEPICGCVPVPEACGNGIDDDCDGLADCADMVCAALPECACTGLPESCNNGIDDDCDGLIDCLDPSCALTPMCCLPAPEMCSNMTDDDCDGLADCSDPDCASTMACCVPTFESCTNGLDDDCDDLVDCADSSCSAHPSCGCVPTAESCGNAIDDDCDDLIDCADPDCASTTACCVPRFESCTNGVDDDCDGLADCADPSCAMDAACMRPCPDRDLGSAVGLAVATGTTVGASNDQTASCAGGAGSPDVAFRWQAPSSSRFVFGTGGSTYDTALHIRAGSCSGAEIACDDDGGLGQTSRITLDLMAGQSIIIIVDGWAASAAGNYVLNIRALRSEAGNCGDGRDNDFDGQTDCADSDCATDPLCAPACPERDLGSAVGNGVAFGRTVGAGNELTGGCAINNAPDVTYSWRAPTSARYQLDTAGSRYDTLLYLRAGTCTGPELACDNNGGPGTTSQILRDIAAGTQLIIAVDGAGSASGAFQLNIRRSELGFCFDGVDNDGDGSVDCADPECAPLRACCVPTPEICNDGADQDCDALIDCVDPNCSTSPLCCTPTAEDCANRADEDCDGLIDCVDPDCAGSPVC